MSKGETLQIPAELAERISRRTGKILADYEQQVREFGEMYAQGYLAGTHLHVTPLREYLPEFTDDPDWKRGLEAGVAAGLCRRC